MMPPPTQTTSTLHSPYSPVDKSGGIRWTRTFFIVNLRKSWHNKSTLHSPFFTMEASGGFRRRGFFFFVNLRKSWHNKHIIWKSPVESTGIYRIPPDSTGIFHWRLTGLYVPDFHWT